MTDVRPKFSMQFSLGNLVTLGVVIFGGVATWVTMQRDIEANTDFRINGRAAIEALADEVDRKIASAESRIDGQIGNTLGEIKTTLRSLEARTNGQDVELGRQDERMTLILQGIARLEAGMQDFRRTTR